jgi:hypothetical protein
MSQRALTILPDSHSRCPLTIYSSVSGACAGSSIGSRRRMGCSWAASYVSVRQGSEEYAQQPLPPYIVDEVLSVEAEGYLGGLYSEEP